MATHNKLRATADRMAKIYAIGVLVTAIALFIVSRFFDEEPVSVVFGVSRLWDIAILPLFPAGIAGLWRKAVLRRNTFPEPLLGGAMGVVLTLLTINIHTGVIDPSWVWFVTAPTILLLAVALVFTSVRIEEIKESGGNIDWPSTAGRTTAHIILVLGGVTGIVLGGVEGVSIALHAAALPTSVGVVILLFLGVRWLLGLPQKSRQ